MNFGDLRSAVQDGNYKAVPQILDTYVDEPYEALNYLYPHQYHIHLWTMWECEGRINSSLFGVVENKNFPWGKGYADAINKGLEEVQCFAMVGGQRIDLATIPAGRGVYDKWRIEYVVRPNFQYIWMPWYRKHGIGFVNTSRNRSCDDVTLLFAEIAGLEWASNIKDVPTGSYVGDASGGAWLAAWECVVKDGPWPAVESAAWISEWDNPSNIWRVEHAIYEAYGESEATRVKNKMAKYDRHLQRYLLETFGFWGGDQ